MTDQDRDAVAAYLADKITGAIALRAEINRLKTVNRDLMETLRQIAEHRFTSDISFDLAGAQVRNTAQLAINKAEDSK